MVTSHSRAASAPCGHTPYAVGCGVGELHGDHRNEQQGRREAHLQPVGGCLWHGGKTEAGALNGARQAHCWPRPGCERHHHEDHRAAGGSNAASGGGQRRFSDGGDSNDLAGTHTGVAVQHPTCSASHADQYQRCGRKQWHRQYDTALWPSPTLLTGTLACSTGQRSRRQRVHTTARWLPSSACSSGVASAACTAATSAISGTAVPCGPPSVAPPDPLLSPELRADRGVSGPPRGDGWAPAGHRGASSSRSALAGRAASLGSGGGGADGAGGATSEGLRARSRDTCACFAPATPQRNTTTSKDDGKPTAPHSTRPHACRCSQGGEPDRAVAAGPTTSRARAQPLQLLSILVHIVTWSSVNVEGNLTPEGSKRTEGAMAAGERSGVAHRSRLRTGPPLRTSQAPATTVRTQRPPPTTAPFAVPAQCAWAPKRVPCRILVVHLVDSCAKIEKGPH